MVCSGLGPARLCSKFLEFFFFYSKKLSYHSKRIVLYYSRNFKLNCVDCSVASCIELVRYEMNV